jgi:hypothetical protein
MIEPYSGFMIKSEKDVSVYVSLQEQSLPFPSLDDLGSQLIPIYDFVEK